MRRHFHCHVSPFRLDLEVTLRSPDFHRALPQESLPGECLADLGGLFPQITQVGRRRFGRADFQLAVAGVQLETLLLEQVFEPGAGIGQLLFGKRDKRDLLHAGIGVELLGAHLLVQSIR